MRNQFITAVSQWQHKWLSSKCRGGHGGLGVVSLTFHELSKIISRKYTIPEITFTVRISSCKFVCVPKAWLWAHVQSFSLIFLQYTNFERISCENSRNVSETPPGHPTTGIQTHTPTPLPRPFFPPSLLPLFFHFFLVHPAKHLRGQRPISGRTYFRHSCSLGVNFMQLWFFVWNLFLI